MLKKTHYFKKKKISLNTSDHETVSQCSTSLPQYMSWKYHQNQNEADPKCFGRRILEVCLGCERMGVFIYKKLFQRTLQEASLISYQPHFSCSWFCSQCTVLPFRRSF